MQKVTRYVIYGYFKKKTNNVSFDIQNSASIGKLKSNKSS